MFKGLQNKILFGILSLMIMLVIVIGFLIIGAQGKLINPFENKTELRSKCEMWNCREPIPLDILSELECSTVSECISKCKNIGALMLRCEE